MLKNSKIHVHSLCLRTGAEHTQLGLPRLSDCGPPIIYFLCVFEKFKNFEKMKKIKKIQKFKNLENSKNLKNSKKLKNLKILKNSKIYEHSKF